MESVISTLYCFTLCQRKHMLQRSKQGFAYLSDKIKAKMAFNVTSEIHGKVSEDSFLVYSSSSDPSELVMASHVLLQVTRELPVMHPSLCVCPSYSPLF